MAKRETLLGHFGINSDIRIIRRLSGAGGKTSLMYALAREILARNETVISTTSAKIAPPTPDQSPKLLLLEDDPDLRELPEQLESESDMSPSARAISHRMANWTEFRN